MSVIITKVGPYRGSETLGRVFSESSELAATLRPGQSLAIRQEGTALIVEVSDRGSHIVYKRKVRGQDAYKPVIDLHHTHLPEQWTVGKRLQIAVDQVARRLIITLAPVEEAIQRRNQRLQAELANGRLSGGSVFLGGGIFAHATHEAASELGLSASLTFAVERDQRYANCARTNNPAVGPNTRLLVGGIQEIGFQEYEEVSHLEIGLPCEGYSRSGGAMRAADSYADHDTTGHLYVWSTMVLALCNPAVAQIECVPGFLTSDAWKSMRNCLLDRGYDVHTEVIAGGDVGAIENRRRCFILAVCQSLKMANPFEKMPRAPNSASPFSTIQEELADDDPRWSAMDYLQKKQQRDVAAGRGFKQCYLVPDTTRVSAIKKNYWKRQSDGWFVRHPDGVKQRLLTIGEQAALKTIPIKLVQGVPYTTATEILGQSGIHELVKRLTATWIAMALLAFGQGAASAHSIPRRQKSSSLKHEQKDPVIA